MPADVMLHAMRFHYDRHLSEQRKAKKLRDDSVVTTELNTAHGYARDVAPYYHPKLATLQSNVNLTGRLTLEQLVEASLPTPANSNEAVKLIEGDKVDAAE